MRYPSFTLRDFLWFVALAGVALAWCGERYERSISYRELWEQHQDEMRQAKVVQSQLKSELLKAGYAVSIVEDKVNAVYVPDADPHRTFPAPDAVASPAGAP